MPTQQFPKSSALIEYVYFNNGKKLDPNEIVLIDTLSGESRKNSYPNGDIVYNNTSLYLADVSLEDASSLKGDSETKRLKFFKPEEVPENLMDKDLINCYLDYLNNNWFNIILMINLQLQFLYVQNVTGPLT